MSWNSTWHSFKGQKLWINVANSTHESFSDVGSLVKGAGLDASLFEGLLGGIEARRMVEILGRYTGEWMRGVFEGRLNKDVLEEEGRFDEVVTVSRDGF